MIECRTKPAGRSSARHSLPKLLHTTPEGRLMVACTECCYPVVFGRVSGRKPGPQELSAARHSLKLLHHAKRRTFDRFSIAPDKSAVFSGVESRTRHRS
ncbi:hypothetical protein AVEN_76838-1 [Araneus ventricosus]|uniref:Uncharacterized protein n=1 Tax=Araneus ventricosus TaxID=182803 RepID=A0A4Y2LR66_ARAVE|nr:hypothetical protein AVEN_76838-1 [Araneus ventricosus]